jgi:enoyl-CoA hydratase/carnithine racemase
METVLEVARHPDCWTFTLNRPEKRNALCAELVEALIAQVDAAHREGVPLLIFRGQGKNFSAGFDFTGYENESEGDLLLRFVRIETLLHQIASSPSMTLGLGHGRNFGAGVDLLAACKRRVCAIDATFRMPGLNFGLVLGTRRFQAIVGTQHALAILGETKTFGAKEALAAGFMQEISDEGGWAGIVDHTRLATLALSADARSSLYRIVAPSHANDDMAELVYSASRPGLKSRIAHYLLSQRPAAASPSA